MTASTTPESPNPPPKSPRRSDLGGLYHGLQFALMTLGGLAVGYWLDKNFLPSPLGTLAGLFGGAIIGMYVLARSVK